jgi:hypothetical protein
MLKVIFSGCATHLWVDVATKLAEENGWQPCYWIGDSRVKDVIKQWFPETVFQDDFYAVRGIVPVECSQLDLPALEPEFLEEMAFHESIVLAMMNRMDPDHLFTYQERRRLYYFNLRYWSAVLDHFQPHLLILPESPHLIFDYILYALCRKRGLKTIVFKQIYPMNFIYPVEKFDEQSAELLAIHKKMLSCQPLPQVKLSPETELHIQKTLGTYEEAMPLAAKQAYQEQHQRSRLLLNLSKQPAYLKRIYNFVFGAQRQRSYLKKRGKKLKDASLEGFPLLFHKVFILDWLRKPQLKRYYESLTQELDFNQPYIYVALHYQPEKTTSPDGGVFADQWLMVNLLAQAAPPGWQVYVKEHPGQFVPAGTGYSSRSTDFYDDLAAIPNVKLVPLSTSSFDLIDKAQAAATITGTVGWEAIIRGKPVLVFGNIWYLGCEGVFYTPTLTSCQAALAQIENGYQIDQAKVRLFLSALEQVSISGDVQFGLVDVTALTQAIQEFYRTHWSTA